MGVLVKWLFEAVVNAAHHLPRKTHACVSTRNSPRGFGNFIAPCRPSPPGETSFTRPSLPGSHPYPTHASHLRCRRLGRWRLALTGTLQKSLPCKYSQRSPFVYLIGLLMPCAENLYIGSLLLKFLAVGTCSTRIVNVMKRNGEFARGEIIILTLTIRNA